MVLQRGDAEKCSPCISDNWRGERRCICVFVCFCVFLYSYGFARWEVSEMQKSATLVFPMAGERETVGRDLRGESRPTEYSPL